MGIRKYITLWAGLIILAIALFIVSYQYRHSVNNTINMEKHKDHFRFAKINGEEIQVFKNEEWESLAIKGIHLSSFVPGYGRYKSNIDKDQVIKWLEKIGDLNANLIKIPSIQPPSFYNAIYDYNEKALNPIYVIHEVMLDEKAILKYHDIYNKTVQSNFKKDIKNTINAIHGRAAILINPRSHKGLYLKDISKYNLGYILGTNTNPEIVTLTDLKHSKTTSFKGKHYDLEEGSPFEAFIAESMDLAISYEMKKYNQISLISYLTHIETDALEYRHEPNRTRHAKINIENIKAPILDNVFVAYKYQPNSVDFLDYEYQEIRQDKTSYQQHLTRINDFYQRPLIITDLGIPSSRGMSKVDMNDGLNRGRFSEQEQGENIVKLLNSINETSAAGAIIQSWQEDFAKKEDLYLGIDITSKSGSHHWQEEDAHFSQPVDFIVHLKGYDDSRIVVHERYNLFNYLYKYYSPVIEKKDKIPAKDSQEFGPIYILNRKKFYFSNKDQIIDSVYYETGKLIHGNGNPASSDYNSLVDFNKQDDYLEIKIPWTILNIKNPIEMFTYDDFYLEGIEKKLKINSIGFSIYDKDTKTTFDNDQRYKVKKRENPKYKQRLKKSYNIVKEFWEDKS